MMDPYASTEILKLVPLIEEKESQQSIQAPAVGYYSNCPRTGDFLVGGSFMGKLETLNSTYYLFLPESVYGQVFAGESRDNITPVQYGQELFRLNPGKGQFNKQILVSEAETRLKDLADAPSETGFIVRAFTTGIFYARPAPDSPPFVEMGQSIEKGKALGLIEVMKTFNHIIFQGTEDSESGKVKKIYVKDAEEVKQGQPLFLID